MIQVADNFNYRGKKPNFDRDSFDTLKSMKDYSDNNIDEGHISYCIETDKHYKFNSNNDIDSTTGKFREFIEGVLPDEEDITSNNNDKLKFADRKYNPEKFSGKGYKILRKNIQDGKNVLSQSMINQQNTVYEIRYDYDLNNQEITIPEGSTLKFEGGSLSNGTIIYDTTNLDFLQGKIKVEDLKINCKDSSSSWYITNPIINLSILSFGTINHKESKLNLTPLWNNFYNFVKSITYNANVKINLTIPTANWYITEIMFIPFGVNIDFCNSQLYLDDVNTSDYIICLGGDKDFYTSNSQKPNEEDKYRRDGYQRNLTVFQNLQIYKENQPDNTKAIYLLGDYKLYNLHFKIPGKNVIAIGTPELYEQLYQDGALYEKISTTNTFNKSDEYRNIISLNYGDGRFLNQIIDAKIRLKNTHGITISNCINVDFEINASVVKLYNVHNEFINKIIIRNSYVSIENSTLFIKYNEGQTVDYLLQIDDSLEGVSINTNSSSIISLIDTNFNIENDNIIPDKLYQYFIYVKNNSYPTISSINSFLIHKGSQFKILSNYEINYISLPDINTKLYFNKESASYTAYIAQYPNDTNYILPYFQKGKQYIINIVARLKNRDLIILNKQQTYDHLVNSITYIAIGNNNGKIGDLDYTLYISEDKTNYTKAIDIKPIKCGYNNSSSRITRFNLYPNKSVDGSNIQNIDIPIINIHTDIVEGYVDEFQYYVDSQYYYNFIQDKYTIETSNKSVFDKFISLKNKFKAGDTIVYNQSYYIHNGHEFVINSIVTSGTFTNKPTTESGIQTGFAYFCTDKQTTEGSRNGIMIYYAGDNTWVDALGRIVS